MSDSQSQVILITGNDAAQIHAEAEQLVKRLAGPELDPFACDIVQEGDDGPQPAQLFAVQRSVQSPPFMGGVKTVWLRHFTAFDGEGDARSSQPMAKALRGLAELIQAGLPADIRLVLDGCGCDGRKALAKACQARGEVRTFNRPDASRRNWEGDMLACLQQAAAAKGITLSFPVSQALLEILGADTAAVETELEKIVCYCGGPGSAVTVEAVRQVCAGRAEQQFWALNNCLGERNLSAALSAAESLFGQSTHAEQTARMLISHAAGFFRQGLRLRVYMSEHRLATPAALKSHLERLSADDKAAAPPGDSALVRMHPYKALKTAEQALRYAPAEMIRAIRLLRDALWQTTTSSTSPTVALENAIMQIVGAPSR